MIILLLFGKASAREAVTCLQTLNTLACTPEYSRSALTVFSQRQFINEV